ncbi:MAG: amidohydrolase family protein [Methanomassiliicoccales archaeon]|nr:MAG: amidohydrolase family protein [Methanomassiliicoccales archaeon]
MRYVSGKIYRGGEFIEGHLGFEDGIIEEIGKGAKKDAQAKGIIVPTFANAHTHIADAVILDEIKEGILEVVAPPNGLKHRVLRNTPKKTLIDTMRSVSHRMLSSGIEYFADFREGGSEGVELLKKALSDSDLKARIFGRPSGMTYEREEMEQLLKKVDGIGLSSILDYEHTDIKRIAEHTKSQGKYFALHASEREREDIDAVLDLKPDFLIHMNKASVGDLKICCDNHVPVVVCPRSEVFFGHIPDIPKMLKLGVTLALGSDNAMINTPYSLLREMEFAYKISRLKGEVEAKNILDMVLRTSRKVLNAGDDICLTQGKVANFIVFQLPNKNPAYALVSGASAQDISMISIDNYLWMKNR